MILEYFGEQFPDSECKGSCDNCVARSKTPNLIYKPTNFNGMVDLIIESLGMSIKPLTLIQTIEVLKGREAKKWGSLPMFAIGKSYSESILRQVLMIIFEKGFVRERLHRSKFNKFISYEFLELIRKRPKEFNLELKVLVSNRKEPQIDPESGFQLQELLRQANKGKLSSFIECYNEANKKFREIRKEFYQECLATNSKLRTVLLENNFTVDNLIPPNILHELCKTLPQNEQEIHKIIPFPVDLIPLERRILECSRKIAKDFGIESHLASQRKQTIAEEPKVNIDDEIFQVNNLSFLDNDDQDNDNISQISKPDRFNSDKADGSHSDIDVSETSFLEDEKLPTLKDDYDDLKSYNAPTVNTSPDDDHSD